MAAQRDSPTHCYATPSFTAILMRRNTHSPPRGVDLSRPFSPTAAPELHVGLQAVPSEGPQSCVVTINLKSVWVGLNQKWRPAVAVSVTVMCSGSVLSHIITCLVGLRETLIQRRNYQCLPGGGGGNLAGTTRLPFLFTPGRVYSRIQEKRRWGDRTDSAKAACPGRAHGMCALWASDYLCVRELGAGGRSKMTLSPKDHRFCEVLTGNN